MHADSIKYFLTQLETADNKSKAVGRATFKRGAVKLTDTV